MEFFCAQFGSGFFHANAADAYCTCTIDRVGGQIGGNPMVMCVMLSDTKSTPTFTNKYFRVPAANSNAVLAILLTAMSNDFKIMAYVDPVPASRNDRLLKQIYVQNNIEITEKQIECSNLISDPKSHIFSKLFPDGTRLNRI